MSLHSDLFFRQKIDTEPESCIRSLIRCNLSGRVTVKASLNEDKWDIKGWDVSNYTGTALNRCQQVWWSEKFKSLSICKKRSWERYNSNCIQLSVRFRPCHGVGLWVVLRTLSNLMKSWTVLSDFDQASQLLTNYKCPAEPEEGGVTICCGRQRVRGGRMDKDSQ